GGGGLVSSSQSSSRYPTGDPPPVVPVRDRPAGSAGTPPTMRRMTSVPPPTSVPTPEGLVLAPFRALRFAGVDGADLARLTSPPYDVIDEDGRRALERADHHNVIALILPRH